MIMSYNLLWIMNWAIWSTFTLIDFRCPEDTRISFPFRISVPLDSLGQKAGPERILGPMRLTPVTKMSFLKIKKKPKRATNKKNVVPAVLCRVVGAQVPIHAPVAWKLRGDAGGARAGGGRGEE